MSPLKMNTVTKIVHKFWEHLVVTTATVVDSSCLWICSLYVNINGSEL